MGTTEGRAFTGMVLLLSAMLLLAGIPGAAGSALETNDLPEPDRIEMQIDIQDAERATWTIEYRYRLATETDEAAFENLSADIEADEAAYRDNFVARMDQTVQAASEATNREMNIENVSLETETRSLPQEYGIVRYQFEWTEFAASDANRILVGDAISGLFLEEQASLQITWSDRYELDAVSPEPDEERDDRVRWRGPIEFSSDEPRLELSDVRDAGMPISPPILLGGVIAGTALIGVGVWLYRDRQVAEPVEEEVSTAPPQEPMELLSNEEQVLRVLEERGGRVKQQEVVQALGWTDAKTSQVVSGLRDSDDIESFRLGRENVLRLPNHGEEE